MPKTFKEKKLVLILITFALVIDIIKKAKANKNSF